MKVLVSCIYEGTSLGQSK